MHPCAPPKFKILVANLKEGSDPSRIGGNPVKQRSGFVLQQVITADGNVRTGGITQQPPTVSATDHTASIQVRAALYWDPTVAAPGPYYYLEETRFNDQYAVAGVEFGKGHGSGAGTVNQVASEMAEWINTCVSQVSALAVADTVYLADARLDARFPVQATNDMSALLGGTSFLVSDYSGTLLSTAGHLRASFYVPKAVKSQAAPVILP